MKTKKVGSFKQKIIISIITVILVFTWIIPTYSQAAGLLATLGGTLLEPICDFLLILGDVANNLIANTAGEKTQVIFTKDEGATYPSASGGNADLVQKLVVIGTYIRDPNYDGETPLVERC